MKSPAAFSTRYLLFLNDPAQFARLQGIKDRTFVRYLVTRNEAMRLQILERVAIARRAREIAGEFKKRLHAESLQDVATELNDPQLRGAREVQHLFQQLAQLGTRGAMMGILEDVFPGHGVEQMKRFERRAMRLISAIAPLERLSRLQERLHVCRLCKMVFVRSSDHRTRALQYCPRCRRRWPSKQRLWYETVKRRRQEKIAESVRFQIAMKKRDQQLRRQG